MGVRGGEAGKAGGGHTTNRKTTQLYSQVSEGCIFLCCVEPSGIERVLVWCKSVGNITHKAQIK